jgi:uncharacterized protein YggE
MAYPVPGVSPFYGQQQNTGIWVTGQGQVSVTPDVAVLVVGVEAQALTVAEAQNSASTAMVAVTQALRNRGVADKDITTINFSIYPVMDYRYNTVTGYHVSNMVTAKIRKISDTGPIVDAVAVAGGNLIRISSISFTVDDPSPYLKQAREKAMADASAKANQLASLSGAKLGPPTYITESVSNYLPSPVYYAQAGGVAAPNVTTPISPGQTQVSDNVQVVYSIQ